MNPTATRSTYRRKLSRFSHLGTALAVMLVSLLATRAQDDSLAALSLEQLASVPTVLSSKDPIQLFEAPVGSFVFDEKTIETLPVDSIAEMLRYAPGVHIIRPSNGIWGVGIRGINSRFFNRVKFNVDEQNVYSSIFAGLFGNQHDLLLDDVASVEVVYGPAGDTWDNNAVNGMVNVLMKTAFETEGSLIKTSVGTESRGVSSRIGWAVNDSTSARAYLKAGVRDQGVTRFDYSNQWDTARGGFRIDTRPTSKDLISISGEAFYSSLGYAYNLADFATGDLRFQSDTELLRGVSGQAKWTRNTASGAAYSARGWLTYSDLDAPYAAFGMATGGVEARSRVPLSEAQTLSLNLGAAYDQEHTRSTPTADWTRRFLHNFAGYGGFQLETILVPERATASFGVDFRHEDKSNIGTASPNARIIYQLSESDRVWASFSQANRTTPVSLSVIESLRSGREIVPSLNIATLVGDFEIDRNLTNAISDQELDKETLDAFEAGYRRTFADERGSLNLNAYYYRYDDIFARIGLSTQPELFTPTPYLNVQGSYDNLLAGEATGFEIFFDWRFSDRVQIAATVSQLSDSFDPLVESSDPFAQDSIQFSLDEFDFSTPDQMATLTLSTDFTDQWNMNTGLRYSAGYDFAKGPQPSIFQLDTRLTWKPNEGIDLSLVGRNLLDPSTQEARLKDFFGHWTETKREIYLEAKARF